MVNCLLLLSLVCQVPVDSILSAPAPSPAPAKKSYAAQILVNGVIGLGFGAGATVFHFKSSSSYNAYVNSDSLSEATNYYNETVFYDNLRNICIGGTVLFLTQAIYYQLKNVRAKTASIPLPELNLGMLDNNKYFVCLRRPI